MGRTFLIEDDLLPNLGKTLQEFGLGNWKGKSVAVKLHMGEYGNLNYVRPPIAGKVVEVLKEAGAKPFLIDSTTLYRQKRFTPEDYLDTARRNGFTEETIGCPIKVSNTSVQKKGRLFPVNVIKEVAEADALLVLSHCKGHAFSGLGGAIKNLGMGCVDTATKKESHSVGHPLVNAENCIGCGDCEKACDFSAISMKGGKASVNYDSCWGCAKCIKACKHNALSPKKFLPDHALANCALSVLECFDRKDLLFVNVLMDISARCDCYSNAPSAQIPNIGILVSDSVLAADNASADLILERAGQDFFKKLGYRNPKQQVEWLEKQGYGNAAYKLEAP